MQENVLQNKKYSKKKQLLDKVYGVFEMQIHCWKSSLPLPPVPLVSL